MPDVMILGATRTAVGRRNGGLSTVHPALLLAAVQNAVLQRAGADPADVGQVIGGCVSQVGDQSTNITRTAWLTAGLPQEVAATTVDAQCGSSQQATALATALIAAGTVGMALGCGVESMSRIPIGTAMNERLGLGFPIPPEYSDQLEFTSQFEGAERIAEKWGISRADADQFGLLSQQRARQAWTEDRFAAQITPVSARVAGQDGVITEQTRLVDRDEGPRESTLEGLARLKPVARPDGVHTAGNSSQISDGAGAILLASRERATELGLAPRARIVDSCLVGSDPVLMLTGPIPATRLLLSRNGLTVGDIDVFEINEAFASVVLAWQRELDVDLARVNPSGGAIALGHPLGGTGAILITKALHELERTSGRFALITMCCGGGLGTGMLIERV